MGSGCAQAHKDIQKFGSGEVTELLPIPPDGQGKTDGEQRKLLHAVWSGYKKYTGSKPFDLVLFPLMQSRNTTVN